MWTVANLADRLGNEYDFFIVSRNHDGVLDKAPYAEVATGAWNEVNGHHAFYVDPSKFSVKTAVQLIREVDPAVIFSNSVFGLTTRRPLEARRKGLIADIPFVLAPCGELSEQCLAIKSLKKNSYLRYAKLRGLFDGVIWKASSDLEASEIRKHFPRSDRVMVAPDLMPRSVLPGFSPDAKPAKAAGCVRLISVARISPKKNIVFLLKRLSECTIGKYELHLVGGIDDVDYWAKCRTLIDRLPSHVSVVVHGAVGYREALDLMVHSHFFTLPTLNENFGYVFLEAMAAGCPLLISENTMWEAVEGIGCGRVARIDSPEEWVRSLEALAEMGPGEFAAASSKAREFATKWIESGDDVEANRKVFEIAVSCRVGGRA